MKETNFTEKCSRLTTISQSRAIDLALIKAGQQGYGQISVYSGGNPITKEQATALTAPLLLAFPKLDEGIIKIITRRAVEKKMTVNHFRDAINNAIDNVNYISFTPSQILNFDVTFDIYSYSEACEMWVKNGGNKIAGGGTLLSKIKINSEIVYIKTTDKERFNIADEINN